MFVLAINGSPRKDGNTKQILDVVLNELHSSGWETELVSLSQRQVRGCTACLLCKKNANNKCVIQDDFNEIFSKMLQADAIIIGSPTYFADVTSEVKALIDRTGYVAIANGNVLRGKIGAAAIAVRRGGATHAFDTINHLYQISRMIIPGSTYWNMVYGLKPGDALNDSEGINNMVHLGKVINWLAKSLKDAGIEYPV